MDSDDVSLRSAEQRFLCRLRGFAFALVWIATACHPGGAAHPRNVILISIDTLRADHLGCYGHTLPTSPNLDAFAAEGIVFEDAVATSPWTLPSHLSLLTGLYPARHGVRTADRTLSDAIPTLATLLAQRGFETAAVVSGLLLGPRWGVSQGFADFEMVDAPDRSRSGAASRITDSAIRWLDDHRGGPVFLFLHYFDVHSDYLSLPRYERIFAPPRSRFSGITMELIGVNLGRIPIKKSDAVSLALRYDAGIRQLDDDLARLFAHLRRDGWLDDTAVLVTSDHGEEFLEHGGVLHTRTHYQEILQIPMILRGPTIPAGVRIHRPVSLVDIVPTLLGLLRLAPPPSLDGVDLRPLWEAPDDPPDERWLFAEAGPRWSRDEIRSVRRERYKLILNRESQERQLYDLVEDPRERENLLQRRPEVASRLAAALTRFMASDREAPQAPEMPSEVQEHLKQLGYY
jgi:arylsulfatase A-like enzyme